ncbi:MAG: porin [Hyphomicrobiales bacterium]|nr:porin [Hyphomicrobiales bacterium]
MTTGRITLAAAASMLLGLSVSANAADLGLGEGCCADLEERVAELESTTARKGNRVVSLQVYGVVSRGLLVFDGSGADEDDSDTVLIDEDGSKFGFRGSATISPNWTAGYNIELDVSVEQAEPIELRKNNVWIESTQLGRVTLGQASTATDGIANIVLANTFSDSDEFQNDIYNEFGGDYGNFDGGRGDVIRYDSPSIAGFIFSASWSDDLDQEPQDNDDDADFWDITLRYSAEYNAFRVAAGIGYSEEEAGDVTTEIFQGSGSLMHIPSGLFASFSAGESDDGVNDDSYWYVNAGIEKQWLPYGKTTIYGEYGEYDDLEDDTLYGLGLTQSFNAAALDVYVQYRRIEEDDGDAELDTFLLGTTIKF